LVCFHSLDEAKVFPQDSGVLAQGERVEIRLARLIHTLALAFRLKNEMTKAYIKRKAACHGGCSPAVQTMCARTMFSPSFIGTCLFIFLPAIGSFAFDADVEYLGTSDYFAALTTEFDKAKTSVVATVYMFTLFPESQEALTTQLAEALAAAKERGCSVRIILDNGGNDGALDPGGDGVNANNRMAYQYLSSLGLDMCFADVPTSTVMHGKTVVIDSSVVFVGSHNWTKAAFSKNNDAKGIYYSKNGKRAFCQECHWFTQIDDNWNRK
jgi:PLD-like domain